MNSADDVLKSLLTLMEKEIQKITIDIWFSDASAVDLRQDCFIIRTTTPYKKEIILTRYGDLVRKTLSQIFSADMDFLVLDADEPVPGEENAPQSGDNLPHVPKFTFDDFIVGSSNRFAHAAALAVAKNPARVYNPLFIYGGSGLGKTHLMKAISNTVQSDQPHFRVLYLKSDDFTNDLVSSLQKGNMEEFRNKYNLVDVLLIDDIQFIAGKEQTQIEFFNTFNTLYDAHKQIVLTSDRPPREIYTLDKRIQSRFEMGLLADIQPPDYETKIAILKQKCSLIHLDVPDSLLKYIATNATANVRQLEGILNHLKADHDLEGGEVSMETVRRAIKDILIGTGTKPTPSLIIEEVCKYYNIKPDRIRVKNQSKDVVMPRQIACYILQQLTDLSLKEIGQEFGGQHHTTVINSINKIKTEMRDNPEIANIVKDLISNLSDAEAST